MRLIGREAEVQFLHQILGETQAGNTNVVLLSGEAGIGKTAILRSFSESIEKRAFSEIHNCYALPSADFRNTLYSQIVEECHEIQTRIANHNYSPFKGVVGDLPTLSNGNDYESGIVDFSRIPAMLAAAARSRPVLMVLDDLHHIDEVSLHVLSHLALALNDVPVCIIAAYRPRELEKVSPRSVFEMIRRRAINLEVRSLSTGAIRELMNGAVPVDKGEERLEELRKLTGGNPKLILEYQQGSIHDEVSTPPHPTWRITPGISIAINERLQGLSLYERSLLDCAAVIGSSFEPELAIDLAEIDRSEALKTFGLFELRGFIRPSSAGQFEFDPGLLREVLYHELAPDLRASLHHRIALILKRYSLEGGEDFQERIARHFLRSQAPDAVEEALKHTRLAGRRYLGSGNYSKACEMFALALETSRRCRPESERQTCDQLIEYAEALKEKGDLAAAEEMFREAVGCAERLGDTHRICALALKVPDYHWPLPGYGSALAVLLCERTLKLVDNPGLKARLASRLAAELSYDSSQKERSSALIALSMEIVSDGEDDPALALHVRRFRDCTLRHPDLLEERVANATEMSRLAKEIGDHVSLWEASTARIVSLFALGRSDEAEREFQVVEQTTRMLRRPIYRAFHLFTLASRAAFSGRFDDCERLFDQGRRAVIEGKLPEILARCWPLLIIPYFEADRLLELDSIANDDWASRYSQSPPEQALRCWLNVCLGRRFEARMQLQHLAIDNFAELRSSGDLLAGAVMLADACLRMGNVPHYAASLYDLLLPYATRDAILGQVAYLGSVSFSLGRLANALSNRDDAIHHFQAAIQRHSQMTSRPWSLYASFELATMLLKDEDRERRQYASAMLSQIKVEAGSRAMTFLAKRVAGSWAGEAIAPMDGLNHESIENLLIHAIPEMDTNRPVTSSLGVFRKIDRFWTVTYASRTERMKHRKGLTLISILLSKPQESIHVSALVGETGETQKSSDHFVEGFEPSDLGAMIDPEAKRSYQARARELRQDLDEAKLNNDPGRVESLGLELRFLMRELARAVGLYGRDRASVSSNERARLRVTNAIKSAIAELSLHHADLARHLEASIKTGLFCSYRPSADSTVVWEL